ncbi:MAG: hypothetical protein ACE5OP_08120 [Candidatus Glassbacteria bacterium]
MGKLMGVIGGVIAILIGIMGLVSWWSDFITLLKGTLPLLLILCGAVALVFGISEMRAQSTLPESPSTGTGTKTEKEGE